MIVTIATFKESADELDEGMRHVREEVVPSIRGATGLRAAYWLVDRDAGKRLSLTVWESGDAAAAAMPDVMAAITAARGGGPHRAAALPRSHRAIRGIRRGVMRLGQLADRARRMTGISRVVRER